VIKRLFSLALLTIFLFVFMLFGFYVVSASDVITFRADVYKFPEIVSVEVPNEIDFGKVMEGYSVELNSSQKIDIVNTGTVNISVRPELVDGNDIIYDNLYFRRVQSDDWERIGDYRIEIPWSGQVDKNVTKDIYAKLDLTSLKGVVGSDLLGYEGRVRFVAVSTE